MDKDIYDDIVEKLDASGLWYKIYNNGIQVNAKDLDGVIHTFYPTTGTIILHASNDKYDRRTKVIRNNFTIDKFISGLKETEHLTKLYFKEETK